MDKRYIEEKEVENKFREYLTTLESDISDYLGYKVNLQNKSKKNEELELDIDIDSHIRNHTSGYADVLFSNLFKEEFSVRLVQQIQKLVYNDEKKSLDWDLFYKLKSKLSLFFIFGDSTSSELEIKQLNFLRDLADISSRTYESTAANIGVIYCNKNVSKQLCKQYGIEILYLQEIMSVKAFFDHKKALIRLMDGKSINILVNNEFKVYGIVRTKENRLDLSEEIISQFISYTLNRSLKKVAKRYERFKEFADVWGLLSNFSKDEKNLFESEFIYFRAQNKKLDVYNNEDFFISFEKGTWRLRNLHYLMYILLDYLIYNVIVPFTRSTKDSILIETVKRLLKNIETLIKTINCLSRDGTSSLIIIANPALLYAYEPWNGPLTKDIALEMLQTVEVLKEVNRITRWNWNDDLYLEFIRYDGYHLELTDINLELLANLAAVDGALVLNSSLHILSYGEIINVPNMDDLHGDSIAGTGTNAASVVSEQSRLAIKVSADGDVKVFYRGQNIITV
ncbi:hypothetical protein [Priestia megaterium]|uniref:hypothetical protein n=1 Tax=Priestia megaterium TaxID=1404 RepID=UPI0017835307|nr:hypothetical protein [Priestia megaterium]MBD8847073.1 hypothetical protein [Priestia megaterium]